MIWERPSLWLVHFLGSVAVLTPLLLLGILEAD